MSPHCSSGVQGLSFRSFVNREYTLASDTHAEPPAAMTPASCQHFSQRPELVKRLKALRKRSLRRRAV